MQKYVNTGEIITTFPGEKQRIFVGADETLFCAMRHKYVKNCPYLAPIFRHFEDNCHLLLPFAQVGAGC